jgi:hypothetical protein
MMHVFSETPFAHLACQRPTRALALWTAAIFCACCGCAGGPGQIRLEPARGQAVLVQDFTQSFISHDAQGDVHIVLVSDPLVRKPADRRLSGQPLEPVPSAPLRQVVHIHVLWRPPSGVALDNPSATNASIDWYVVAEGTGRGRDLVHYQGAGYVVTSGAGNRVGLRISNATIRPAEVRGSMKDPIGAALVNGHAVAVRDAQRVREVLADVEQMVHSRAQAHAQSGLAP